MSKKEAWEPCPRCNSNRVQLRGGCFVAIIGAGIASLGIWLFLLPVFGRIAGTVTIIIGLLLLITSPFAKNQLQCQDCYKTWKYPYKQEIKEAN